MSETAGGRGRFSNPCDDDDDEAEEDWRLNDFVRSTMTTGKMISKC